MAFNQLVFVILFMPLSIILYRVCPERLKKILLILLSLVFIAWGNLSDLLYIFTVIVFNYFSAKQISDLKNQYWPDAEKIVFVSAIVVNILFLGYFKYLNFFREIFGLRGVSYSIAMPIGISFVTFSLISFLCDVHNGKEKVVGFTDFALFVTFFPKLVSGPIVKYEDYVMMIKNKNESTANRNAGIERFILGLAKKTLLAGNLGVLFNSITSTQGHSVSEAWLGALAYTFMLYFDFSGYSDMAIGLGKIFGYKIPENFMFPYISVTISDFWRRWHISLGAFFRDYVYIPLGGNRKGTARTIFNLFVVFALTGIWHGANFTFIFWGLYHFVLSALERLLLPKDKKNMLAPLTMPLTFLAVVIGWVFFFSPSITETFRYLGNMIGIGCSAGSGWYYFKSYIILLIAAVYFSLPFLRNIIDWFEKENKRYNFVRAGVLTVLFLMCIVSIVSDTYSSFLYAAF